MLRDQEKRDKGNCDLGLEREEKEETEFTKTHVLLETRQ